MKNGPAEANNLIKYLYPKGLSNPLIGKPYLKKKVSVL